MGGRFLFAMQPLPWVEAASLVPPTGAGPLEGAPEPPTNLHWTLHPLPTRLPPHQEAPDPLGSWCVCSGAGRGRALECRSDICPDSRLLTCQTGRVMPVRRKPKTEWQCYGVSPLSCQVWGGRHRRPGPAPPAVTSVSFREPPSHRPPRFLICETGTVTPAISTQGWMRKPTETDFRPRVRPLPAAATSDFLRDSPEREN